MKTKGEKDKTEHAKNNNDIAAQHFLNGVRAQEKKDFDAAIAEYSRAVYLNPDNYNARNNLACCYDDIGQYDKALKELRKLISLEPRYANAWHNRGFIYSERFNLTDNALADYSKAIELHQGKRQVDSLKARAGVYRKMGLYERALSDYTNAISLDPRNAGLYNDRGFLYGKMGMPCQEVENYTCAIRVDPAYELALTNRALSYRKMGLLLEAACDYEKLLSLKPNNADYAYKLGMVCMKLGWYEMAQENVVRAMAIDKEYQEEDIHKLVKGAKKPDDPAFIDFAAALLCEGFYIDVQGDAEKALACPLSFGTRERVVVFPDTFHVGKTIRRHLRQYGTRYDLRYDADFAEIYERCSKKHGDGYLTQALFCVFTALRGRAHGGVSGAPYPVSYGLYLDGALVAGDIGVEIGNVYTSYSGYHDAPNSGMAQLVLMAERIWDRGFLIWDLGPGMMTYKSHLGAAGMTHKEYKEVFTKENSGLLETPPALSTHRSPFPPPQV